MSTLDRAIQELIAVGRRLDARGLALATSGNYSVRVDEDRIAITVSGCHKGRLGADDVMSVDLEGNALDGRRASAETALHAGLYRLYPAVNAVLHVHSVASVTLTRFLPELSQLTLERYEMLKAFPGITTHEARVALPVFDNSQDIAALSRAVTSRLEGQRQPPAYLLRGHGIYAWGTTLQEAERVVEALEHLLACELETMKLRSGAKP